MAGSKRQTTFAKLARERRVQEKRELKREKKEERKLAAAAEAEMPTATEGGEAEIDGAPAAADDDEREEADVTT